MERSSRRHQTRKTVRRVLPWLLGVGLAAGATPASAEPVSGKPGLVTSPLNVRPHTDPKSGPSMGGPARGRYVDVFCWRDGKTATYHGRRSQRWFLIQFVKNETSKPIGFISVLAFDNQPRVPKCVSNRNWPQRWAPSRTADVPSMIIQRQVWPGEPAGSPPPSQGDGAPASPPPPTYSETTGGETHTWTNYTNAGGYEGPTIPAYTTVQIACKLQGFRVANGNTWWYRIASDPWNNAYYASADAFYNNGQTSGSLRGTPWVDPNVRDC